MVEVAERKNPVSSVGRLIFDSMIYFLKNTRSAPIESGKREIIYVFFFAFAPTERFFLFFVCCGWLTHSPVCFERHRSDNPMLQIRHTHLLPTVHVDSCILKYDSSVDPVPFRKRNL